MSAAKRKADDMAATANAASGGCKSEQNDPPLVKNHVEMLEACSSGRLDDVLSLLSAASDDESKTDDTGSNAHNISRKHLLAAQQDPTTGRSPLMVAAQFGNVDICKALLEAGAPWNAVDRYGKCAGDYATEGERWDVVNYLVEEGTKAEVCHVHIRDVHINIIDCIFILILHSLLLHKYIL